MRRQFHAHMRCKYISFPGLALLLGLASNVAPAGVAVTVDTTTAKWTISRHLVGLHIVYSAAPDKVFANGKVADWARKSGIATARYPGGTVVKFWDWKQPTGVLTADRWDPKWKPAECAPAEAWMSLDEYLVFVDRSGITPLFGVNTLAGYTHQKTAESVRRAADMVRYVKERKHAGAFWYIGNEEEGKYKGGVVGYAEVFRQHAAAMKAVDPAIRIFWNLNNPTPGQIQAFLKHDGGLSDGLETHGKWPCGGDPASFKPASYEEWLDECPLRDRKNHNRQWRNAAEVYRRAAAVAGRPNYLIANNEYGIGKNRNVGGFNRYTYGLLMTDLLQELFIGNWDMSCFWDTIRDDKEGLLSAAHGYRMNPFHFGMELLAEAQGRQMYAVQSSDARVYGMAAGKEHEILLYLINKQESARDLAITLAGNPPVAATGRVMRNTQDLWGELANLPVAVNRTITTRLPPLSFSQIRLQTDRRGSAKMKSE